jgi:serine/threonine protein kinase
VLDGGETETGRPYFVMELVRGVPILEFCDEKKLPTEDRLRLFRKVCQAIHHAHQKGVIHRDIKPSNVLVTLHDDRAVPKVIDFGIAKATQHELTEKTVFTRYQEFLGTPAYMSPEQAQFSGLDIDTRTDIYSLGVLLYELLTGRTPFDTKELMSGGYDAMRKIIREREPARPSTQLDTLSQEDLTSAAVNRRGPDLLLAQARRPRGRHRPPLLQHRRQRGRQRAGARCPVRGRESPRRRARTRTTRGPGRRGSIHRGSARDRDPAPHQPVSRACRATAASAMLPHARTPGAAVLSLSSSIRMLRVRRHPQ